MSDVWDDQIEALEEQIRQIRANQKAVKDALRESVKPVYKFTIEPADLKRYGDECWDDTIVGYRLEGVVTNKEELEEVGYGRLHEGGLTYIFNKGTGKFVMTTGGGSIFIQTRGTFASPEEIDHGFLTLDRLAAFVTLYPQGGDVTEIIVEHQEFTKKGR